jgi:hypothetical protein
MGRHGNSGYEEPLISSGQLSLAAVIFFVLLLFGGAIGFSWYKAGIQQQVWERQGVHMTRWEVFVGSKPIVRQLVQDPATQ